MKYLFELSKEYNSLSMAEVLAVLNAEKIKYKLLELNEDLVLIDTNQKQKVKKLAERLASSFLIDELLFTSSYNPKEIEKKATENKLNLEGSIAIKYRNRSNHIKSEKIVKQLAKIYTKNRKVSLEKPDIQVRAFITDSKLYVCLKKADINRRQFEERKVQYRPFFSPISLHPRLARTLVNLSGISKKGILLDPFCGTGGFLLEAGLIGCKVIGSDIEEKMIQGCKKTLQHYNIKKYSLITCDIGQINKHIQKVDAIVTDLPYGRATTTKGEKTIDLYKRTINNIFSLLKPNKKCVLGISNKDILSYSEKYLKLIDVHIIKAHRSLNRYFAVFKK